MTQRNGAAEEPHIRTLGSDPSETGWKAIGYLAFASTVAGLAWWASRASTDGPAPTDLRAVSDLAGLWLAAGLGAFLFVLAFGPGFIESHPRMAKRIECLGRRFQWLAGPAIALDALLVGPIAWICGLGLRRVFWRYLILFAHIGGAAAALWAIATLRPEWRDYSLAPISWAFIALISVVRTWMRNEGVLQDAADNPDRADQDALEQVTDLRDEALLAVLLFFAAIPVALMEVNALFSEPRLFTAASGHEDAIDGLVSWYAFFGAELVKAVPLVDWAEVYEVGSDTTIQPAGALGLHIVFATRILVDLVLLGALFYAIDRVGRISRQKRGFESGYLRVVDPHLEGVFVRRAVGRHGESTLGRLSDVQLGSFASYSEPRLERYFKRAGIDVKTRGFLLNASMAQARDGKRYDLIKEVFSPAYIGEDSLRLHNLAHELARDIADAGPRREVLVRALALRPAHGVGAAHKKVHDDYAKFRVEVIQGLTEDDLNALLDTLKQRLSPRVERRKEPREAIEMRLGDRAS